jgi:hypothetical protein
MAKRDITKPKRLTKRGAIEAPPIVDDVESAKTKRRVTLDTLKVPEGSRIAVKILCEIKDGKDIPGSKMKRARIMEIALLSSGEVKNMVVAAIVESELTQAYPNNSYVGKCFRITKHGTPAGKRYHTYSIEEIEDVTKK